MSESTTEESLEAPGALGEPESSSAPLPDRHVATDAEDRSEFLAHTIEEVPAADAAQVLGNLPLEEAADVAEFLDPETASEVLSQMEPALAASVISDMEEPEAAMVIAAMDPDDRVDVLEHVDAALRERLLSELTAADAADVRHLQRYPRDTAGGIMTTQVTALRDDLTVEQAIEELRRLNEQLEQMFYVYVVDRRQHLVGVLSMRDLILARPNRLIHDIARKSVVSVPATTDQEEVARLMRKYKYLAVP
ncbi:MAG TPA: CBS domain-containing protein, partial [Tepidisphaeraceae bacterium]